MITTLVVVEVIVVVVVEIMYHALQPFHERASLICGSAPPHAERHSLLHSYGQSS